MSTAGQLTSGCAPATVCGDFADEPAKKFDIQEEDLSAAVALGAGLTSMPAVHPPASNASASQAAIEARPHHRIR
jgi:hypothetical protein